MSARRLAAAVTAVAALACVACSAGPGQSREAPWGRSIPAGGQGEFVFDGYEPLADHPVRVFYQAPADEREVHDAQVLIVIPGTGRNAEEYREEWAGPARRHGALLLVPEFDEDEFPGSAAYNVGDVLDEEGAVRDEELWTFQIVEALFDHVVDDLGLAARRYALFGHSAGAQFVHRMVMLLPDSSIRAAVAANAGWYTMPDDDVPFPYGLDGGPIEERDLAPAFDVPLTLLLGGDDVDPEADNLRQDSYARSQGEDRLTRGLTFFGTARDAAVEDDASFAWGLTVVPGVAHDSGGMVDAAVPLVLDR